ncbi:hypothetical protein [Nocardia tengchongensis]|uniref:hypothetical protein n=1 Tax=Nocardia tengchongensis TaxID=2055889 RepID=UPI003668A913
MILSQHTIACLRDQADLVLSDPESASVEQVRDVARVAVTLLDAYSASTAEDHSA